MRGTRENSCGSHVGHVCGCEIPYTPKISNSVAEQMVAMAFATASIASVVACVAKNPPLVFPKSASDRRSHSLYAVSLMFFCSALSLALMFLVPMARLL